jgi:PhoH-like ATPase
MAATAFALEHHELDSADIINALFKHKTMETPTFLVGADGFCILKCGSQSALIHVFHDKTTLVTFEADIKGVKPKDAAQRCLFWSLQNKELTVCLGTAGSGKTFISSAFALEQMERSKKKIVLLKPTRFIGGDSNAIAAVPGGITEKLAPYTESFLQHMRNLIGWQADQKLGEMEEHRNLEFAAVELCRGRHFADSIVILDEAQNLSFHELTSIISRVDDSSKLLILGDPLQIDLPGVKWAETGLAMLLESTAWYDASFASVVELETSYRGKMARLAGDAILELHLKDAV